MIFKRKTSFKLDLAACHEVTTSLVMSWWWWMWAATKDILENVDEKHKVEKLGEDESVAKLEKPIYM